MTFVNCSNHPSANWSKTQREAAEAYGTITDVAFPAVETDASDNRIEELTAQTVARILECKPKAVMCMGEFVVCFRIVQKLKENGILVLAGCTERQTKEYTDADGSVKKESVFVFKGFREY